MSPRLVSVDIWDTVLRRRVHPEQIKLMTARHLSLAPGITFKGGRRDYWHLYSQRLVAERSIARANTQDDEYELASVFNEWLRQTVESGLSNDLVQRLEQYEVLQECKHSYLDPDIVNFLGEYPAEKRVYLSDFYMKSDTLRRVLEHHGADALFSQGIVSCDVGLNKRSGRLFSYLHESQQVSPEVHTHIGDNEHSDVRVPQRLGINAIHYLPESETAKRRACEEVWKDRSYLLKKLLEESAACAAARKSKVYLMGRKAAPLFIGFVLFVAESSLVDQVDRLFFFTREGEFFFKVWRSLFPVNRMCGFELPEAEVLEVSRIATFGPSLGKVDSGELMRLWRLFRSQSPAALLNSLGLDPGDYLGCVDRAGLMMDEVVSAPWDDKRIQKLLSDPEFLCSAETQIAANHEVLSTYLAQRQWFKAQRVGIVDIGWRGTIQDNLAILSPGQFVHGYYLALQRFLNPQPNNTEKSAFGPNVNLSRDRQHFLDAVSPIEMLCNSPEGSVSGYELSPGGGACAVREFYESESQAHEGFANEFQRGVCDAAAMWAENIERYSIASSELREPALRIWQTLIDYPPQELADAYSLLNHNELFGMGALVDKRSVPSLGDVFSAFVRPTKFREVAAFVASVQWPAGVWARTDLGFVHRVALVFILRAGLLYKRILYAIRDLR
jgi:FMN phosphatase YigB (HAD superfamily)